MSRIRELSAPFSVHLERPARSSKLQRGHSLPMQARGDGSVRSSILEESLQSIRNIYPLYAFSNLVLPEGSTCDQGTKLTTLRGAFSG